MADSSLLPNIIFEKSRFNLDLYRCATRALCVLLLQRIICPFGHASRADVGPRANNKGAGTNRFVLRSDESLCAYACHSSTLLEAGAGVAVETAKTSSQKYACAHAPRALIDEHRPSLQAASRPRSFSHPFFFLSDPSLSRS